MSKLLPRCPPLWFHRPHPTLHRRRPFHSTPPRQFLEPALLQTHTLLTTLHTTFNLPWYAVIPLTSILLRLAITTPISTFARHRTKRRLSLQPLLSAWQSSISKNVRRSSATPKGWEKETKKLLLEKRKEVLKRHGCQSWKMFLIPVVQLPVWVVASLTLRGMTGMEVPGWALSSSGGGGGVEEVGRVSPLLGIEEGFVDGGALWFGNLLEVDAYLGLPMAFSFLLFLNLELQAKELTPPSSSSTATTTTPPKNPRSKALQNLLRLISLAAFPIAAYVPAGLSLYWTTSALYSLIQNIILRKVIKIPPVVGPCGRGRENGKNFAGVGGEGGSSSRGRPALEKMRGGRR